MTAADDSVTVLERALDQAGDVLAAVHAEQLEDPTPCGEWDVAALIGHLVAVPVHFLEAEIAVHTWDLVRATGQDVQLAPEVAERGLGFMSAMLTPENRGGAFGPAVEVPEDAPVYDRLAGFAGRDVS